MSDVLVVGAGPAGRSVAGACAARGLDVVLVDPRPDAPWRRTYGAWAHDLPAGLPGGLVAARGRGVAIGLAAHELDDDYVVLDTDALQRHLARDGHAAEVRVRCGRVAGTAGNGDGAGGVRLTDGTVLRAPLVVDASGAAQVLSRGPSPRARPVAAEQTAFGVIVDAAVADRVTGGRLLFMDWRADHGVAGWPTFLYAIPLDAGQVLLEETSLARRPGLGLPELRTRLRARLRARGLREEEIPDDPEHVERVRFPVDTPRHDPPPGVVAVGAATPVTHPATGYSLAASLALAPRLAQAVAGALEGRDAVRADEAARRVTAPPAARAVHAMRRRGLDVLLRMPPERVPAFFDGFFTVAPDHRRAYLGADQDVGASLAAMTAVFAALPTPLRTDLVLGSILGPGRPAR